MSEYDVVGVVFALSGMLFQWALEHTSTVFVTGLTVRVPCCIRVCPCLTALVHNSAQFLHAIQCL